MITSDFARYIHMEIVGRVFILDKTPIQQGFEIYAFGASVDHDKYIDLHGRAIETTRGKRRQWSDLGRAYNFIKESGWSDNVVVELYFE